MRYTDAVAAAPPGNELFSVADLGRLSRSVLALALAPGPAAPPLEDLALALGHDPALLGEVARAQPDRSERLFRLAGRPVTGEARAEAGRRLVRGLFWWLVYELEPDRWLRLEASEPVHPELLRELGGEGARVLEVGAGGGRLTVALAGRAATLVAVEPVAPLRAHLRRRTAGRAMVVAGAGQRLPIRSGWADLTVSCAAFGPDPPLGGEPVLTEMNRCTRPGGVIALVGPEQPAWFRARGFESRDFDVSRLPARLPAGDLGAFFGPDLTPPHELLTRHR
ncbi:MAG: class I SAM-dependent methyltransferase [Candidatus Dormibacteraceae bacterium]